MKQLYNHDLQMQLRAKQLADVLDTDVQMLEQFVDYRRAGLLLKLKILSEHRNISAYGSRFNGSRSSNKLSPLFHGRIPRATTLLNRMMDEEFNMVLVQGYVPKWAVSKYLDKCCDRESLNIDYEGRKDGVRKDKRRSE